MRQYNDSNITLIDRIVSAASYFTAGGAGFIWMIVCALMHVRMSSFLLYHVFQSIFLSILYFLIVEISKMLYVILYRIPLLNAIPYYINMPLGFLFGLSIIQVITSFIILYLGITAFLGLYSYIPWVSDIINRNTGRR